MIDTKSVLEHWLYCFERISDKMQSMNCNLKADFCNRNNNTKFSVNFKWEASCSDLLKPSKMKLNH